MAEFLTGIQYLVSSLLDTVSMSTSLESESLYICGQVLSWKAAARR